MTNPENSPCEKGLIWPLISLLALFLGAAQVPVAVITGANSYLLLLSIVVWRASRSAFPKALLVIVASFVAIISVGLMTGLSNERYAYLKDAWYFINPVLTIATGYCFGVCGVRMASALKVVVVAGVVLALIHLSKFGMNPALFSMPATEVRMIAGNGNFLVGISVALLLANWGRWREVLDTPGWLGGLMLTVGAASMALASSRTLVIVALLFLGGMRGMMAGSRFLRFAIAGVLALSMLAALSSALPPPTEQEKKTFTGKLLRSMQELAISDYQDEQSINDNYRGFESARAYKAYVDGGPVSWLGGRGMGYYVDLGIYLQLGEGRMRYIPILHNGIFYLLVKTGVLGVLGFLACFGWLFMRGGNAAQQIDPELASSGRIIQSCVAVSIATAWLIAGPFNKSALLSVLLVMGYALAVADRRERMFGLAGGEASTQPGFGSALSSGMWPHKGWQ